MNQLEVSKNFKDLLLRLERLLEKNTWLIWGEKQPEFSMNIFNVGTPKDETVRVGCLSRLKQLVFVGYVPVASNSIYFSKINDGCIVTG